MWVSGNLFSIGQGGNYELWIQNPIAHVPVAHNIWDPHFSSAQLHALSVNNSYSSMYNQLYSIGLVNVSQLYNLQLTFELLAIFSICLAKVHLHTTHQSIRYLTYNLLHHRLCIVILDASQLRFDFHIIALLGSFCIMWCGHLVHVAIPASRGGQSSLSLFPIFNFHWSLYSTPKDNDNHIFGSHISAGQAILTFSSSLKQDTCSSFLTDIAHHHLALAVLIVSTSLILKSTYRGYATSTNTVLHTLQHLSLQFTSLHFHLSYSASLLSVCCQLLAQHVYSLAPYPYLSYDYVSTVTHYVHHSWIASFLALAGFAHFGLFMVKDYTQTKHVIFLLISQKASILSHLSQVCLWLGFHTLGVYIHNDTVVAFANPKHQILIEPVFAQSINPSSLHQGPGDLLAHHALALGLHVSTLIVLKGSLDARGSTLMPDKVHVGYGFACDGPGRGGTCDISAWDSLYLATFWMLNTVAWFLFYFHWKHLTLWQNTVFQFDESSTYLNGWFRDYLWFNSAPLIRGYDAFGATDISVWAWLFLAAHLCWATGFMFLISWRGYWQELIDIILYMHLKTPILYDLWNNTVYTPVALSIVQARFIGLVHFSCGFILTYAAFVIGATC
jgi:photosystem I P700 chlorophyll a apoprotein A2